MRVVAVVVVVAALAALTGCSSQASSQATRPPPSYGLPSLPPRPAFDPDAKPANANGGYRFESDDVVLSGTPIRAELQSLPGVKRTAGGALGSLVGGAASSSNAAAHARMRTSALPAGEAAKEEEKIEREAQLAIEVKDVNESAARIAALVRSHDGTITKDQRSTGAQSSSAEIIVRVPSAHFDAFTSELAGVGEIRNRSIKALDTTLEHRDLGILVANLEAALARYRDLLQKATDPLQVLAVERELERVRSDLDRIKGRLDFLRDRVARATVAIALHSPETLPDVQPGHRPQISSGLRALSFIDVRESGTSGYVGSGLTLRLPRSGGDNARGFILDVDVMRACCKARPERSNWAYDVLLGYDLYSESLQSGRRRWFNPYLGARVGFAQTQDRGDFAAAGVFGLEIFKTAALMIDVQVRAMAMVGNPDGPHAAAQPSLGFDLGF